ncbi:MAG TPA: GMC oxidoreductase [Vicinamibacterales bacterium]|jgi:choline dehydrogenase-like flavoprotein
MVIDIRKLPDLSILDYDLCIIGAGPAGLTLATELRRLPIRICLLESGSIEPDADSARLAEATAVESDFAPPSGAQRRQFGGAANGWIVPIPRRGHGVRYLPLSDIDFEERPWIPDSGWPFSRDKLDYGRAQEVCGLRPLPFDTTEWERQDAERLPLDPSSVVTQVERIGMRDPFTRRARRTLEQAQNVWAYLHAVVTSLEPSENASRVEAVRVACLNGQRYTVRARVFVLAAGGIENARLLLLSSGAGSLGIGNEHDTVGRYYIDHVRLSAGVFRPADRTLFTRAALYDIRAVGDSLVLGRLALNETLLRNQQLLHSAVQLIPKPPAPVRRSVEAIREIGEAMRTRGVRGLQVRLAPLLPGVRYIISTAPRLAIAQRSWRPAIEAGWSGIPKARECFDHFELQQQVELAPHSANRVSLSRTATDPLGLPLAEFHWRWTELDRSSQRRSARVYADALIQAGLGTVDLPEEPIIQQPAGAFHPMGTTRMHDDARRGVTDANARVHSMRNLYIAGSSLFPTGGYANPTLTIIALTIRLANHLAETAFRPLAVR